LTAVLPHILDTKYHALKSDCNSIYHAAVAPI